MGYLLKFDYIIYITPIYNTYNTWPISENWTGSVKIRYQIKRRVCLLKAVRWWRSVGGVDTHPFAGLSPASELVIGRPRN